jgi:hypothetical protein
MAYINPAPGTTSQIVLKVEKQGTSGWSTAITVPALQDITVNAANDVFTWSQLDSTAKKQIATTSTNSLSMNLVVDDATFFGTTLNAAQSGTMAEQGLIGTCSNKTFVK